jgi:hypothetical protein
MPSAETFTGARQMTVRGTRRTNARFFIGNLAVGFVAFLDQTELVAKYSRAGNLTRRMKCVSLRRCNHEADYEAFGFPNFAGK